VNVAVFALPRYRKSRLGEKPETKSTTVKLIILWIIFLLGLIWNWMQWHHR
jgi:hypothetical protein